MIAFEGWSWDAVMLMLSPLVSHSSMSLWEEIQRVLRQNGWTLFLQCIVFFRPSARLRSTTYAKVQHDAEPRTEKSITLRIKHIVLNATVCPWCAIWYKWGSETCYVTHPPLNERCILHSSINDRLWQDPDRYSSACANSFFCVLKCKKKTVMKINGNQHVGWSHDHRNLLSCMEVPLTSECLIKRSSTKWEHVLNFLLRWPWRPRVEVRAIANGLVEWNAC